MGKDADSQFGISNLAHWVFVSDFEFRASIFNFFM